MFSSTLVVCLERHFCKFWWVLIGLFWGEIIQQYYKGYSFSRKKKTNDFLGVFWVNI